MQLLESCRLEEAWRVLLDYGVIRVLDLLELEPDDVDAFPITPIAKKKMASLVSRQREEDAATSAGATAGQGRRQWRSWCRFESRCRRTRTHERVEGNNSGEEKESERERARARERERQRTRGERAREREIFTLAL